MIVGWYSLINCLKKKTPTGRIEYQSPEMAVGGAYSIKNDIWFCGLVLLELILRKPID